jgi:hypothetical protein
MRLEKEADVAEYTQERLKAAVEQLTKSKKTAN